MNITRIIALVFACALSFGASAQLTQEQLKKQWEDYYALSKKTQRMDMKLIAKELEARGKKDTQPPKKAKDFGFGAYDMTPAFFKSEEGKGVLEVILSFQTPSGGWSKDVEMTKSKRRRGEGFGKSMKSYVPTFDNDGTSTQVKILAKAATVTGNKQYKAAVLKSLELIINAQYPNGGWPQNYPLNGGYHDLITYNDRSTVSLLEILKDVANGASDYAFVPKKVRQQANEAFLKGINAILMTQVNVDGKYAIWGAQHDQFTFKPAAARAFEPASLASSESVDILMLLMSLEKPPAVVVQAVDDAVAWFEANKITGKSWVTKEGVLKTDPAAKPLWARFYEVGTNKPIFGDRNGKVYYDVKEVSEERRTGYGWYKTDPNKMIKLYKTWRAGVKS